MFQTNKSILHTTLAITISLLSACSDKKEAVSYQGTFVDSAVAGLNYQCGEFSGVTDIDGHFNYLLNDTCTFSLGDLTLGTLANMSAEKTVISPFDITDNKEQAIKIASLLQTIDDDGNPDNGIDVNGFDSSGITDAILSTDEESFYQAIFDLTGLNAVNLNLAQQHMEKSLAVSAGYHSEAIERVIDEIDAVNDFEQLDIQSFLANIHAILDAGDDSNNNDIQSLKAIIAIYEVYNDPRVQARITITDNANNYTEFLPQIIDASMNSSEILLSEAKGTTEDLSEIFFEYSSRLVSASDALAISFADPNYVANYGGESGFKLTAKEAYRIQVSALGYASLLSYFSAYDYGSDTYYESQSITQEIDVIETVTAFRNSNSEISTNLKTISAESSFTESDINPAALYLDDKFIRLHADEKFLTLAKESLIKALDIGKTLISIEELDISIEEQQEIITEFDKYLNNLRAADGAATPIIIGDDTSSSNSKLNLQAFYSTETALDRDDYLITASINCGDLEYSLAFSKYMNQPMCASQDYNLDMELTPLNSTRISFDLDWNTDRNTTVMIHAVPADVESAIEPISNSIYERFLLECTKTDDTGVTESCLNSI